MKKLITIIGALMIALTLVNFQCNENIVEPPPGNPPGYQSDIPWPSLADSPWPIYRGDPFGRGLSNGLGANSGIIDWEIDTVMALSGITLGEDSTVYVCIRSILNSDIEGLAAYDISGNLKWFYQYFIAYPSISTPIIINDGSVIISFPADKKLCSVKNGNLIWEIELNNGVVQSGMNISDDGKLMCVGVPNNSFYAINKEGNINWEMKSDLLAGGEFSGISISPDSKSLYIPGRSNAIIAIDLLNKMIKWSYGNDRGVVQPLIDSESNIYLITKNENGEGVLHSITPGGEVRWFYELGPFSYVENYNHYAMDRNGNLYLGLSPLTSLDYEGKLRWEFQPASGYLSINSPISIDNNNRIYFSSEEDNQHYLYCINDEGQELFRIMVNATFQYGFYSPAIGYNSTFIAKDRGKIWRIK